MADQSGIEIDPNGKLTAEDLADERHARLRELRGEFKGYYTNKDDTETALRETYNFRGQSGNNRGMADFLKQQTQNRLGGPKEEAITVDFPLAEGLEEAIDAIPSNPTTRKSLLNTAKKTGDSIASVIRYMQTPSSYIGMPDVVSKAGTEEYEPAPLGGDTPILFGFGMTPATGKDRGPSGPTPGDLWKGLGSFIKDPERPMNPATLAAWGTWNLANMGVEGGKKIYEAYNGLTEMIYGEGYQVGQEDEAGALAGIKAATAVAGAGLAVRKPPGSLSSFSGREGAQNWAKAGRPQAETALDMAEMLEKKGYKEEQIRDLTKALAEEGNFGGVSKGADGKWRFEISDEAFDVSKDFHQIKTGQFLDEIIKHEDLFSAHPEMKDIPVIIQKINPSMRGFRPEGGFDGEAIHLSVRNAEDIRNVISHEWQHWLQKRNDFARGSSPEIQGVKNYRRSAGENEANSVQERLDMTAAERADQHPSLNEVEPETGKRVPRSEQIVTMTDDLRAAGYEASTIPKTKAELTKELKEVDRKINTYTSKISKLQSDIASDRYHPVEKERKIKTITGLEDKLTEVYNKKEILSKIEIAPRYSQNEARIKEPVQGSPKTLSEDIGNMAKRRSKLERLTEREQSLITVIENETRILRKERAQRELVKVQSELKFVRELKEKR